MFGWGRTFVINDNFRTTVNQEYMHIGSASSVNLYSTDGCDIYIIQNYLPLQVSFGQFMTVFVPSAICEVDFHIS